MTQLNVPTKVVIPKNVLIKVKNCLDMKQNQFKFKPFDQVLVRDNDTDVWYPAFFRCYNRGTESYPYTCDNISWRYCIPYNEETAHLADTDKPYKPSEPKVWQIASTGYNDTMTSEELSNFIQGAVINNKDITDFRIRYIEQ